MSEGPRTECHFFHGLVVRLQGAVCPGAQRITERTSLHYRRGKRFFFLP